VLNIISTYDRSGNGVYADALFKHRLRLDPELLKSAFRAIYEEAQHDIDTRLTDEEINRLEEYDKTGLYSKTEIKIRNIR